MHTRAACSHCMQERKSGFRFQNAEGQRHAAVVAEGKLCPQMVLVHPLGAAARKAVFRRAAFQPDGLYLTERKGFYGQERIPACGEPNLLRDAAEPKLLRAFLAADKPVLGICRGIQVMNIVLGGTLYQDIKPFEHVPHNDHWAKVHTVTVRRGTLLSRLLGQDTVLVNSQHHQAADRIAPELEIAALSEDGIVEALEKPDAHFCLGVQWHPEWLSDADPAQQGLFGAFVEACRG